MNELVIINGQEVEFELINSEVFTSSLNVASVFEKQHQHIIAKIRELPLDDFNASNFRPVKYLDQKGEQRPMYNLTRDGFSLLVMGFTGAKAYRWKVEFIKAFNKIEAMLKDKLTHHRPHLDTLMAKFGNLQSEISSLKSEADSYKTKYYESLERENLLLRQKAQVGTKTDHYNKMLSVEEKAEILRLFQAGVSKAEICRRVKRSDTAVNKVLRGVR